MVGASIRDLRFVKESGSRRRVLVLAVPFLVELFIGPGGRGDGHVEGWLKRGRREKALRWRCDESGIRQRVCTFYTHPTSARHLGRLHERGVSRVAQQSLRRHADYCGRRRVQGSPNKSLLFRQ